MYCCAAGVLQHKAAALPTSPLHHASQFRHSPKHCPRQQLFRGETPAVCGSCADAVCVSILQVRTFIMESVLKGEYGDVLKVNL
jgi:hypothetical protein